MNPHCKGQFMGRRANQTERERERETSTVSYTLVTVAITIFHSNKEYKLAKANGLFPNGWSKHG